LALSNGDFCIFLSNLAVINIYSHIYIIVLKILFIYYVHTIYKSTDKTSRLILKQ